MSWKTTLITLFAAVVTSLQSAAPLISTPTYIRWPLSAEVQAISLMDQKTFLLVDIAGPSAPEFKGAVPQRPPIDGLQVWVLRNDGTAVRQRTAARASEWGSMGGWATKSWEITYDYAAFKDLAAVVARVGGRLYLREVPSQRQVTTADHR